MKGMILLKPINILFISCCMLLLGCVTVVNKNELIEVSSTVEITNQSELKTEIVEQNEGRIEETVTEVEQATVLKEKPSDIPIDENLAINESFQDTIEEYIIDE